MGFGLFKRRYGRRRRFLEAWAGTQLDTVSDTVGMAMRLSDDDDGTLGQRIQNEGFAIG